MEHGGSSLRPPLRVSSLRRRERRTPLQENPKGRLRGAKMADTRKSTSLEANAAG